MLSEPSPVPASPILRRGLRAVKRVLGRYIPHFDQTAGEAWRLLADAPIHLSSPGKLGDGVLVVRVDAIGDYMLFRQCLRALRHSPRFTGRKIILCGNAAWGCLAEGLDREAFDEFIPVDRRRFMADKGYRQILLRSLRVRGFSCVLHPTFSRDFIGDSLALGSKAPVRIGFLGDSVNMSPVVHSLFSRRYTELIKPSRQYAFELDRNRDVLAYLDVPLELIGPFQEKLPKSIVDGLSGNVRSAFGCPAFFLGASDALRRWPASAFSRLVPFVSELYAGKPVLLLGGKTVADSAGELVAEHGGKVVAGADVSILDLLALVAHAPLLVTNDSVAAHMGAAYDVPTVAVSSGGYGGRFLSYPADVAPRFRAVYPPGWRAIADPSRYHRDPRGPFAIGDVPVEAVEKAVKELLCLPCPL